MSYAWELSSYTVPVERISAETEKNAVRRVSTEPPTITGVAEEIFRELSTVFACDKGLMFEACLYFASRGLLVKNVVRSLKEVAAVIKMEWGKEQEPELVLTLFEDPDDLTRNVYIIIRTYLNWKEARHKRNLVRLARENILSDLDVGITLAPLEA